MNRDRIITLLLTATFLAPWVAQGATETARQGSGGAGTSSITRNTTLVCAPGGAWTRPATHDAASTAAAIAFQALTLNTAPVGGGFDHDSMSAAKEMLGVEKRNRGALRTSLLRRFFDSRSQRRREHNKNHSAPGQGVWVSTSEWGRVA